MLYLIFFPRTALLEAGFTPDDYFYDVESPGMMAYTEDGQPIPGTAGSSMLMQVLNMPYLL